MDGFRYVVGVLMAVTVPPAVVYWFVVHPFVGFWRRLGSRVALTLLGLGYAACLFGCWLLRDALLGQDLGTNWWLIVPGLVLYLFAAGISVVVNRHLKFKTLIGVPEIATEKGPGKLLRDGIYGRVRHPRYASFLIGIAGFALIINYAGLYVMAALMFPALHVIAVLEERELHDRFGEAYAEYCAAVPRLIPRFGRA